MNELREEISLWLDDLLPADRVDALRRRIESDPAARREYETLRRAVEALRALPAAPAPAELLRRIESAAAPRARRRGRILFLGAAAALAAGLLLSLRLLFPAGEAPATGADRLARVPRALPRDAADRGEPAVPAAAAGAPAAEEAPGAPPAEGDRGRLGDPEKRRGGAAGEREKKEAPPNGDVPLRLLDVPPAGPERADYLKRLGTAAPEAIRKALATTRDAKTLAGPVWSFRVASAEEARILGAALERAFPAPPSPEPEAKVTLAGVQRMEELRISATDVEAARVASWLERFAGASAAAARAPGVSVREEAGQGREAPKPRLFRIRLLYEVDEGK
jgi:hypothetical protein